MKKSRFLAVILCVMLVFTAVTPMAVMAEDYSDYVPGAMPADLIEDGWIYGNTNSGSVSFGWSNGYGTDTQYKVKNDITYDPNAAWAAHGTLVNSSKVNGGTALSPNTTYVFSAKFRNAGAEGTTPKFGIYYNGNQGKSFPNEYGALGWTPGSEHTDYKITFSTGSSTSGSFVYGIVSGAAGDIVHMNYANGMYLSVEEAYDITNEVTGAAILLPGESTTIKSEVVNQIGIKGTLEQNITYTVLNEDRTEVIGEGITVIPGEDGEATVEVASNVTPAKYVILAKSEDYTGFRKGVTIDVKPEAINDTEPGADPYYDVTLDVTDGSATMGIFDSLTLEAKLVDSTGETGSNPQDFEWYILDSQRYDKVTAGFNLAPSVDTTTAELTLDNSVQEGTYYIVAETEGLRESVELTVDKSGTVDDIIGIVSTQTAEEVADKLPKAIEALSLADIAGKADADNLATVITAGIANESITDEDSLKEYITRAALVSLYNIPSSEVTLYDASGSFNYADKLKLADIDVNGVTLYSVAMGAMTAEGKNAVQSLITGKDFADYTEFITALTDALLLKAIQYPAVSGTAYLKNLLTADNLTLVGVDGTNYLALGNNIQFLREQIRGKTFTIETLEAALAGAYESDITVLNADYAAESKPTNLITSPNGYNYNGSNSGDVSGGWAAGTDNTQVAFTVKNDFAYTSGATWITHGLNLGKAKYGEADLEPNTTYVYKTSIKSVGDTAPYFNITYKGNVSNVTTNEYGTTGYAPGTAFEDFCVSFNTGANTSGSFWIGLSSGVAGNAVYQNIQGAEQYLAPEAAYDIEVSAAAASVPAGETLNVEAGVLNQLGLDYSGAPNFIYYAVTEDRSADAQGFTFTPSADTKSVQVSVDASVPLGRYVIIAEETSLGIDGFKKGVTIEVTKPAIRDTAPGTDPLYEITLNPVSGTTTMGVFDSLTLQAKLVDSQGAVGTNPQSFTWYALNAERTDKLTEGIILTPSTDTTALDVTLDAALAEGTYYIVAEAQGLRKSIELTVDKTNDISDIIYRIDNETAAQLAPDMATVVKLLGMGDTYAAKADTDNLAAVIKAGAGAESLTDKASLLEYVKRAALVSLYNIPASDVSLTDAAGNFAYEAELKLTNIDANGVTLYSAAKTELSSAGKAKLQTSLTGKSFATYADFIAALKENLLFTTIANPKDDGTAYLATIITPANLAVFGIDGSAYFALSNPAEFELNELKGKTFTIQSLGIALANAYETSTGTNTGSTGGVVSGGGAGGSGGSGGGSLSFGGSSSGNDDNKGEDFKVSSDKAFTDVAKTHWAYSDIHYLRSIGVINGTTDATYEPDATVTREQFLKILIEAFKLGTSNASTQFVDIDSAAWYAPYVKGGVALGIVNGKSATEFGVGEAVTRQDACVMIDRALSLSGEISEEIDFDDAAQISDYAKSAVATLSGYGIVKGVGNGRFDPQGICTRAQAAKIISSALSITNSLGLSRR